MRRWNAAIANGSVKTNYPKPLQTCSVPVLRRLWVIHFFSLCLTEANEKYAGEVILQKRYTTDSLPFKRVKNRGEVDMYHIQNTHVPIISKEDFNRVQSLFERRTQQYTLPQSYPFTKKVVCSYCGASLKRIVTKGKVSWKCYRHFRDKELCPLLPIPEPHLHATFMHMWNKLLQNRKYILTPLLSGLRELDAKFTADPEQFSRINKEISELTGQVVVLNQLRGKGYLDDIMFTQQTDELNVKIDALQIKRRALLKHDECDSSLTDTQALAEIMETSVPLTEFDETAFASIVEKITADNKKLLFRLKGGLELLEYMTGKECGVR